MTEVTSIKSNNNVRVILESKKIINIDWQQNENRVWTWTSNETFIVAAKNIHSFIQTSQQKLKGTKM